MSLLNLIILSGIKTQIIDKINTPNNFIRFDKL